MRDARWCGVWTLVAGLLVVAGAACSSDGGDAEATADRDTSAAGGEDAGEAASDAGGGGLGLPTGDPVQAGRSIIATADISIEVADVRTAAAEATEVAASAGGFLARQEALPADGTAALTLRVPTDAFQGVLGELEGLGEVLAQRIDTEDVTEQVVDLESRIGSARASVERVRELLGGSGDVVQLAAVERELAMRESDLESLLGRQRVLGDQVALATIRVDLRGPAAVAEADDGGLPGFVGGLRGGWDGFLTTGSVLVTGLGYALPFLVVAAVAGAMWLWVRRRGVDGQKATDASV